MRITIIRSISLLATLIFVVSMCFISNATVKSPCQNSTPKVTESTNTNLTSSNNPNDDNKLIIAEGKSTQININILKSMNLKCNSRNMKVATVSQDGLVKAISKGVTQIDITDYKNKKIKTHTINVTRPVTKIILNTYKIETELGACQTTLIEKIIPEKADESKITWSCNNPNVATIASNGKVTIIGEGTAIITAKTTNNITANCYIKVGTEIKPTPELTNTPIAIPTITSTPTYSPTPTNIPTAIPTYTPTPTITLTPTNTPTAIPTNTPIPTYTLTPTPMPDPTKIPTSDPTCTPTPHTEQYTETEDTMFVWDGTKIVRYIGTVENVVIPRKATVLGAGAFSGCINVASVVIPDTIKAIESRTFAGCVNLTTVIIPDSVTCIEGYAFIDCYKLETIRLPDTITRIDGGAFWTCHKLKNINIPLGVTKISDNMFYYCGSLEIIQFHDRVTTIGSAVFMYCSSLKPLIIPSSVVTIGSSTFGGCDKVTSITILGKTQLEAYQLILNAGLSQSCKIILE